MSYEGNAVRKEEFEGEMPPAPQKQDGFRAKSIGIVAYLLVIMYFYISMTGPDSMNLILPALENTFGWLPADVAVKLGGTRLITIISMFILGSLFIRSGVKKILIPATVFTGIFTIGMANITSLNQLVWANIAISISTPAAMIALGALTANWYVRTRGRILGIITVAFPLSTATYTLIGTKAIEAIGYRGFYNCFGIVICLVGIAGLKLVIDKPEDVGMSPDGIPFTEQEKEEIKKQESFKSAWTLMRILKCKEIWAYTMAWAMIALVVGSIMSQMIPVFTSTGLTVNKALAMMSVAALAGMPLSYIWGVLDDKCGTPITTAIFCCNLVVACLGMAYGSAENTFMFYTAILCIALASAGMPNLMPSGLAYMVGRKEFVNIQRYTYIINNIFISISLAYVPVLYAKWGSYRPVFLSLIIFSVLAIVFLQFTRKSYDPERLGVAEEASHAK